MRIRGFITESTTADCTQGRKLIEGIDAEYLLADKGYDTDEIVIKAMELGMEVVIPPKKNRREQRAYDKDIYEFPYLVENAFLHLKRV
jgi:IS5 family transposase